MAEKMQDQARVVVIGGGVVGASVLFHLTKLGWTDVIRLDLACCRRDAHHQR